MGTISGKGEQVGRRRETIFPEVSAPGREAVCFPSSPTARRAWSCIKKNSRTLPMARDTLLATTRTMTRGWGEETEKMKRGRGAIARPDCLIDKDGVARLIGP
jgi:hypothetical protein